MNMNYLNSSPRSMELLEVGPNGGFQSLSDYKKDAGLRNTLFHWLYPQGHVAYLSLRSSKPSVIPTVLDEVLSGVNWQGVSYVPVGSRRSIERLEIYLVDESTHEAIATRFQRCSETLIAQFDLLVRACDVISDQDLRVLVLPHAIPGDSDWRGWIRRSVFSKLGLAGDSPSFPFVMAFGELQGKGELGVMDDAIADRDHADIIIPKKCLKPTPKAPVLRFDGRVVVGAKQSCREQQQIDGINHLLDEHVCRSGCNSFDPHAMRRVLMRAFKVREMYAVHQAGN